MTIHGSKGLQYPVVYLPFPRGTASPARPDVPAVPRRPTGAPLPRRRRRRPAAGPTHQRPHRAEEAGEELRLLYVALTRAQSQVVTWWAPRAEEHARRRRCTGCCSAAQPGRRQPVKPSQELHSEDDVARILGIWQSRGGPVYEESRLARPARRRTAR